MLAGFTLLVASVIGLALFYSANVTTAQQQTIGILSMAGFVLGLAFVAGAALLSAEQ